MRYGYIVKRDGENVSIEKVATEDFEQKQMKEECGDYIVDNETGDVSRSLPTHPGEGYRFMSAEEDSEYSEIYSLSNNAWVKNFSDLTDQDFDGDILYRAPIDKPKGEKYDSGKPRWHMMDLTLFEPILALLEAGAITHGKNNWQKVENLSVRYGDALTRHALRMSANGWDLTTLDLDNYCTELANIGCCLYFQLWELREKHPEIFNKKATPKEKQK